MFARVREIIRSTAANIGTPLGLLALLMGVTCFFGLWSDARYFSWSLVLAGVIAAGLLWPWVVAKCVLAEGSIQTRRVHAQESVTLELCIHNRGILAVWGLKVLPHPALPVGAAIPPIWPWQKQTVSLALYPATRGWFPAEPLQVTTRFPFDLWGRKKTVPITPILIWPASADLSGIKLHQAAASTDAELIHRPAQQGAILGMRNYRPGDHYRQISWRHVAKIDRLVVRELEEPFGVCHRLVIDTCDAASFEQSLQVAAGLIESCPDEPMSLCCGGCYVPPGCGAAHVHKMLDALAIAQVVKVSQARHNHHHSLWIGPESESPASAFVRSPLEGIVIAWISTERSRLAESA